FGTLTVTSTGSPCTGAMRSTRSPSLSAQWSKCSFHLPEGLGAASAAEMVTLPAKISAIATAEPRRKFLNDIRASDFSVWHQASGDAARQWADGPMYAPGGLRDARERHAATQPPLRRPTGAQRVFGYPPVPGTGNRTARLFSEPGRRELSVGDRRTLRGRRAHRSIAAGHEHRGENRRAGDGLRAHVQLFRTLGQCRTAPALRTRQRRGRHRR